MFAGTDLLASTVTDQLLARTPGYRAVIVTALLVAVSFSWTIAAFRSRKPPGRTAAIVFYPTGDPGPLRAHIETGAPLPYPPPASAAGAHGWRHCRTIRRRRLWRCSSFTPMTSPSRCPTRSSCKRSSGRSRTTRPCSTCSSTSQMQHVRLSPLVVVCASTAAWALAVWAVC